MGQTFVFVASCLDFFFECLAAAVLTVVKVLPLKLHGGVVGKFGVAFGIFEPVFHKRGNKVGKQERVNAFVHIFGFNRDEHEVNNIVAAIDCFEQVVPSEWE